jgi:hypothetical protein
MGSEYVLLQTATSQLIVSESEPTYHKDSLTSGHIIHTVTASSTEDARALFARWLREQAARLERLNDPVYMAAILLNSKPAIFPSTTPKFGTAPPSLSENTFVPLASATSKSSIATDYKGGAPTSTLASATATASSITTISGAATTSISAITSNPTTIASNAAAFETVPCVACAGKNGPHECDYCDDNTCSWCIQMGYYYYHCVHCKDTQFTLQWKFVPNPSPKNLGIS